MKCPKNLILNTYDFAGVTGSQAVQAERLAVGEERLRARLIWDSLKRLSYQVGNWLKFRKTMNPQFVWYASYGSNLYLERFLKYIEGGKLEAPEREYTGCVDKTHPRQSRSLIICHELFFACRSPLWNAAMAFVRQAESNSRTFGRMYLITDEQFDQVVRQERGMTAAGPRLCPDLSYMAEHPMCYLNRQDPSRPSPTDRQCSYGMILNLGAEEGHPILTFTAVGPDAEIVTRAPSREYIQFITHGIRETFPDVTLEQIRAYFLECDGVRGRISAEELVRWLGDGMNPTQDKEKYDACVKALQFELEQFWKRALFFWGFIGAAFVAYATSESHPSLQAAIASFGFVCSVVWTLANRGSKFWYEDWERHLRAAEPGVTGSLYGSPGREDVEHNDKRGLLERIGRWLWRGKRYSPSKLAIALSDYLTIFWFCILTYTFVSLVKGASVTALWPPSKKIFAVTFIAFSFIFAILLRWLCHTSKD